jgi:hypothetical protein
MTMIRGQVYRCQNRDYRCEIIVVKASTQKTASPMCCCGSEMKKLYEKPSFGRVTISETETVENGRHKRK